MRLVLLEQEVGNRKHSYDPLCLKVVAICMNITDFSLIKYQPYFAVQIGGSCRPDLRWGQQVGSPVPDPQWRFREPGGQVNTLNLL